MKVKKISKGYSVGIKFVQMKQKIFFRILPRKSLGEKNEKKNGYFGRELPNTQCDILLQ